MRQEEHIMMAISMEMGMATAMAVGPKQEAAEEEQG
jgi:hypothetical protein